MKLRGVDFGRAHIASGAQGFFGEGYWYHEVLRPLGLDWEGMTFVAKTTTALARRGNMPLKGDFTPKEMVPKCIVVKPWKGVVLNSVGLSGPGAEALLSTGRWQARTKPFFLSFMSTEEEREKRIEDLVVFVSLLKEELPRFRAPVGLQINYSCPNVGLDVKKLVGKVSDELEIASELGIPLVPKFNVVLPVEVALEVSRHRFCDGLCVSNTIPWGQLPDKIDWKRLFGTDMSPLAHLGGGGLSGEPLFPILFRWIETAMNYGIRKPICAGGGILSRRQAEVILRSGASAFFLGSIAMLRPWRVRGIARALA